MKRRLRSDGMTRDGWLPREFNTIRALDRAHERQFLFKPGKSLSAKLGGWDRRRSKRPVSLAKI